MKRILAAVLASSLLLMTACNEAKETEVTTEETTVSETTSEETSEETQITFTDGQQRNSGSVGRS
ncbi:MAG: hypothetical protein K6A80_05435 [Saccharofermentans sp.]|nr:hypothetical protein [Saccharofermentans sp.]